MGHAPGPCGFVVLRAFHALVVQVAFLTSSTFPLSREKER